MSQNSDTKGVLAMMNILVATNDAYYPRLKIFTNSLSRHCADFSITVLCGDLRKDYREDFLRFCGKNGISARFVEVKDQRSGGYKLIHQITVETYYRFQILEIYPIEDRAIWMDIDTVLLQDIAPLYYDDFEGNYVIACPGNNVEKHLARLGLAPGGCYFNAGVIVFNLERIRKDFAPDFLYDVYEKYEDIIRFSDQDVLNIAFAGKIKGIDSRKYNYIIPSGYRMKPGEFKHIRKNVAVVHYIRHIKPWQYYFQGRIRYLYLKAMLPIYPLQAVGLAIAGELYRLYPRKKTLENSVR